MNKNKLIKEMNKVIEKNNRLFKKCEDQKIEIADKDLAIEELKIKVASLEAEIELVKALKLAECKEQTFCETKGQDPVDEDRIDLPLLESEEEGSCNTDIEEEKTEIKAVHTKITSVVLPESALSLASAAIGRVVVKCAELCNHFASVSSANSKDLINLALGRTEVFKSDLLGLINGREQTEERLFEEIKTKENDVLEYFELLLSQL